jgi:ABC-2 type transport system permease protein
MMLSYKAWRESRLGFLLSIFALALFCALYFYSVDNRPDTVHRYTDLQKTYLVIYHGAVRNIFIVLTLLLGLGGLLRERAHGTLEFTLSFPVRRRRIVLTRAAVGLPRWSS